jgi:hypothetical protein
MSEKVAMLMHRAALNRDIGPQCGKGFLEAGRAVKSILVKPAEPQFSPKWDATTMPGKNVVQ